MAKGKSKGSDLGVYKKGEEYVCTECNTTLPLRQPCPTCKREIDWDRVFLEIRH